MFGTKKYDIELTPNFNLSEFIDSPTARRARIKEQYHVPIEVVYHLHDLCLNLLQPLRYAVGKVRINSGYRCPRLNKKIGGVPNSQHTKGMAADIIVSDINLAVAYLKTRKFDQMIIYNNFIHISYRAPLLRQQIIDKRK